MKSEASHKKRTALQSYRWVRKFHENTEHGSSLFRVEVNQETFKLTDDTRRDRNRIIRWAELGGTHAGLLDLTLVFLGFATRTCFMGNTRRHAVLGRPTCVFFSWQLSLGQIL